MTNSMNHIESLDIIQTADHLAVTALEVLGDEWSSIGLLLSACEMIADNREYDLRVVITRYGYQIEWEAPINKEAVKDDFKTAFEILAAPIDEA